MSAAHRDEIAKLESLYAENPEGRVFTHLAEAYRKAGDLERAREILSDGIERHPDYASAHVVMGRVLMDQGRGEEADAAFRRVLELDPHNLIAIRSRADIARSRGDRDTAIAFYTRLLDQEPGDDEVREILDDMETGGDAGSAAEPGETAPYPGDEGEDAEVRTETIAQVYARQGLYELAADVYRGLVRARPEDEGLRDRLAEMEQLAAAQTERTEEVEAVSDFDGARTLTDSETDSQDPWAMPVDEPSVEEPSVDEPSVEEPAVGETISEEEFAEASAGEESADEESPWGRAPWEQIEQEPVEADGAEAESVSEEPAGEPAEEPAEEPAGWEPTGWSTEEAQRGEEGSDEEPPREWSADSAGSASEGPESGHPEIFRVEGLEPGEVDTEGAETQPLNDLEVDETDPGTGLRIGATPDSADPGEDLSEEMGVRDVPEPPEERPWESGSPEVEEPEWLSGVRTAGEDAGEDSEDASPAWLDVDEASEAEDAAVGSVWTGREWAADEEPESTPHAWTEEEEEPDTSPPVRDYFGSLLGWSGPAGGPLPGSADEPDAGDRERAGAEHGGAEHGRAEPAGDQERARAERGGAEHGGAEPARAEHAGEEDDDLDMFRSWLESLKQ